MLNEAVMARKLLNFTDAEPLVKVLILCKDSSLLYYVAPAPRAPLYTPLGCSTRGSPAYDIMHCRPVFLKDSWRIDLWDMSEEGMVYKQLAEAKVGNIPRCIVSGNISTNEYHAMKTSNYAKASWACHSGAHFIPH